MLDFGRAFVDLCSFYDSVKRRNSWRIGAIAVITVKDYRPLDIVPLAR